VLSLSIRCTNEVVKAGDEIDIEFKITNRGTNDYRYADRTYDYSGRMPEYWLVAKTESGKVVPDPRADYRGGWAAGGLFQYQILKPGQSFTKIIPLNRWALVKEPGPYSVTGTFLSDSYSTDATQVVSAPIHVNILPRTAEEMDAYIVGLSNQIASLPPPPSFHGQTGPTPELDERLMKLMFTCSPKVVPTLLNAIYQSGHSGYWECEALRFYVPHNKEVKQAIVATAARRGLTDGMQSILSSYNFTNQEDLRPFIERSLAPDNTNAWQAGAVMAQQYADDFYTPRLIALATETNSPARHQAIYALAANRTDEGVTALKALLHDPDLRISQTASDAIKAAYNSRGFWQGRRLKPEDFDEKYQQPTQP